MTHTCWRSLLREALLRFPIVVGGGKRLVDGPFQVSSKLLVSRALDNGAPWPRYERTNR